jgi:outer membrane protein assembly factor BamE (lipoprotein component of BamABCDE complex)
MSLNHRVFKSRPAYIVTAALALGAAAGSLSGCSTAQTLNQGYVIDEDALKLVPVGSSREQVLLTLGTPSTTATFDNEVFYYISQKRERPLAFMKPHIVSQNVLAIYFDKDGTVERIANYTLKDGRPFDMISRTTPTGGKDQTFLGQILSGSTAVPQINQQRPPGSI